MDLVHPWSFEVLFLERIHELGRVLSQSFLGIDHVVYYLASANFIFQIFQSDPEQLK